jgi:hypothetical protein
MLDAFIAVADRRERAYTQQTQREEESLDPPVPAFSIRAIVDAPQKVFLKKRCRYPSR